MKLIFDAFIRKYVLHSGCHSSQLNYLVQRNFITSFFIGNLCIKNKYISLFLFPVIQKTTYNLCTELTCILAIEHLQLIRLVSNAMKNISFYAV